MENIKEIAKNYKQFEPARKIADGSTSIVDIFNFIDGGWNIFFSEEEDNKIQEYYDSICVKNTQIVSVDSLKPEHLIKAYEEFLLEPHKDVEDIEKRLSDLQEVMDWLCGQTVYFGSSEGDGACIGYWEFQDEDNS